MSKGLKNFLGVLSVLSLLVIPIIIGISFLTIFPTVMDFEARGVEPNFAEILPYIGGFMAMIFIVSLISLGLMIFYIVHVAQDPKATSEDRILWILLLLFFSNMTFPFYWYFRIYKSKSVDQLSN